MNDGVRQPAPRRGRPKREEVATIDRDVLTAARLCFVAQGFDGTTMETIAGRAGVTKTTLYLRYPDKSALLRAVLEDRIKVWGEISTQTDWMMGETTEQRLRYFAVVLLNHAQSPEVRAFVKLVDGSFGWAQSIGKGYREILRRPMLRIIADEIDAACKREGCVARDPERAAASFIGMLSSYAFLNQEDEPVDPRVLAEFADHVTDIFVRGREGW